MEPFAHDKAEGAKKVIVAASSSSNHGLRARSSKSSGSPRNGKNRATKTYAGNHNLNGSLIGLSWPSPPGLGSQLSPGNASADKIPLGHYSTGRNFENSLPGMQLNSNKFLSDSNVAKFNATLFSSASSHSNQGLDVEEAMDIDHQDVNDESPCAGEGIVSEQRASGEKSLTDKYLSGGESSSVASGAKTKVTQNRTIKLIRKFTNLLFTHNSTCEKNSGVWVINCVGINI